MAKITIEQEFKQPINKVFDAMSKNATYNQLFFPLQVVRSKDGIDPNVPDGEGSIRRMGFAGIQPLQEQITQFEKNKRIEYKLINNPLIAHHVGVLKFTALSDQLTLLTYTIELKTKVPFLHFAILQQLKLAIGFGLRKLARQLG